LAEAFFRLLGEIRLKDLMMRTALGMLASLLIATASISYFKYERPLQPILSGGQHYIVLDETIWPRSRPDLEDLRIYSTEKEIPYMLTIARAGSAIEQKKISVLQPGTLNGKTQFLLDMSDISRYDRVELKLRAKNFVAHARVEGGDDAHGVSWSNLGTTTLYDLSDEKLGHNSTLHVPVTTYKYLRVWIDDSVKPLDLESATAGINLGEKAVWRDLKSEPEHSQQGHDTVFTLSLPKNVPLERVLLSIDPSQANFRRDVEIQSDNGMRFGSGEISRIHMNRNGQKIDVQQPWLEVGGTGPGPFKIIIHNGDDAPLKITDVHLQQYERRIYFDSDPGASLRLYYGDEKLEPPIYDYAKLFQRDPSADRVLLAAEEQNAAFRGRPDDRPWSERHPALLWVTIIAAVMILGGIALRSMKPTSS
jgi:hypothetical protein